MGTLNKALDQILDIDGAIGTAIVDYESGVTLGTKGGEFLDMELAGASNTNFVLSSLSVLEESGIDQSPEDILVSLSGQYHLTRFSETGDPIFIYLILERDEANLVLARRQLSQIEADLELDFDPEEEAS